MKHNTLSVCLAVLVVVISATLAISAMAQELDEFVYLPVIIKSPQPSPQPPDCNSYEPNDTPEQANWIQDGETQTQCIVPETDVDWVKFSVDTESEMILKAAGRDLELRLYDSNLNLLDYDYGYWHNDDFAQIAHSCGTGRTPLLAGIYYASVEHWLGREEVPSYDITLTVNACPDPVVLANHSVYTVDSSSPYLMIVGEVQNNGEIGLSQVKVITNLFNDNDQLIDTGTGTVELGVLPPGDKTCFELSLSESEGWSYYEFEMPTYYSTSNDQLQKMTVHDDNGTYNPDDGSYRILGFIRNDNDVQVRYVQPIATLYNASGTVVGCGYTSVNSTHLDPGQSSSFELTFSGWYRDYADVASYRVQVDGNPQ